MFTCIEILEQDQRVIKRVVEKFFPPAPVREYVQLKGATPFLRLRVRENNVDWSQISSMLSGDERVILKDVSVCIPENVLLEEYVPAALGMKIMFRTLYRVLEKVNMPQKINLTVFDRDGYIAESLEKIVPYVRNLYVYTEKISEYFFSASEIMDEYGASVKINEYETAQEQEGIVIADEYVPAVKKADFVFVADKSVVSYNTVTGNGIFLEDEYRILKGESIDDFCFASALYEKNGAAFFAERDFLSLFHANKKISACLLAEKIRQSVMK